MNDGNTDLIFVSDFITTIKIYSNLFPDSI